MNYDITEDLALHYQCNRVRNESVLIMLVTKDTNQLEDEIIEKIKTTITIDYPDFQEQIDMNSFYELNDNECQRYLDGIGCDHFITLNLKLNDLKYSGFLILLVIVIMWLLGIGFCCFDIFRSTG